MTNREKLLNTNIYDLLVHINSYVRQTSSVCIIDMIENDVCNCEYDSCKDCLQNYLNAESITKFVGKEYN